MGLVVAIVTTALRVVVALGGSRHICSSDDRCCNCGSCMFCGSICGAGSGSGVNIVFYGSFLAHHHHHQNQHQDHHHCRDCVFSSTKGGNKYKEFPQTVFSCRGSYGVGKGALEAQSPRSRCPCSFFIVNTNESETDLQKHLVKLTQKATF